MEKNEDIQFNNWVNSISEKYKNSQLRATMNVNCELIMFYFDLGQEITKNKFKSIYGSKFYSNLSKRFYEYMPNVKGFSDKNLRYVEKFYLLYKEIVENVPQVVGQLCSIPWGHHRYIIDKCKNEDKAFFFVLKTIENNWSRSVLLNFLSTDLYEREGKSITNFENVLPMENNIIAKHLLKDPYCFDFLAIDKDYSEKELKDSLVENIQKFLLELGTGFSFVGKEKKILVGNTEYFTDLLFYNIQLHAYVVIEVKINKFKPSDLGQLSFYVTSINHILKTEDDNPTIGLLICKEKDKIVAEYSLESYNIPMGVSTYELDRIILQKFNNSLPSPKEIKNKL